MQMQMFHRLPTVFARIHDNPVAVLETLLAGNIRSGPQQVPQQRAFLLARFVERGDVFPRNNQNMHRSLRIDVRKGVAEVVYTHVFGFEAGNLLNFLEKSKLQSHFRKRHPDLAFAFLRSAFGLE